MKAFICAVLMLSLGITICASPTHAPALTLKEVQAILDRLLERMRASSTLYYEYSRPIPALNGTLITRYKVLRRGSDEFSRTDIEVRSKDQRVIRHTALLRNADGLWKLLPAAQVAIRFPDRYTRDWPVTQSQPSAIAFGEITVMPDPAGLPDKHCYVVDCRIPGAARTEEPPSIWHFLGGQSERKPARSVPRIARYYVSTTSEELRGYEIFAADTSLVQRVIFDTLRFDEPSLPNECDVPDGYQIHLPSDMESFRRRLTDIEVVLKREQIQQQRKNE